jgi:SNF2 family DNA or RNA helicase
MILKTMEIGGRKFEMSVGVKPNKLQEIYDRVDQVSVRALKGEVLDLPDKIYQQIKIEPTSEQRRIYDELKAFMYTEYKDHELTVESKISLFTRFRQIAGGFFPESGEYIGSNKLDFIREDTEDYQGKVIIWAAFRAEIEWLHKQLKDCSVCYVGGQTTAERQEVLHRFKNDDSIKFLIANPQTAAYGLNLQFAQLNYYYSNTLPPEFRNQSEGRTDRNGQIASPVYKDLLTSGTVDSKILANLKQKIDLSTCFQHMEKSDFFSQI